MPLLNTAVQIAAKPFPRVISPKAHTIVDYMMVGSFLATAALFWKTNKRAAIAALIAGGTEFAVSALTNYPGGIWKFINFGTHRDIDFGLGAMTATLPEFLAFKDANERKFFLAQGAIIAGLTELTRLPNKAARGERRYAA